MNDKLKDYIASGRRTDNAEINKFIDEIAGINPDRILDGGFRYYALLNMNIKDIEKILIKERVENDY